MDKNDALRIIVDCAKEYRDNLENKNVLFIYQDKQLRPLYFETIFEPRHFHHFTGTKLNADKVKSATNFYELCLDSRLSIDAFQIPGDGTTELKLRVLPNLMKIHKTSKMIGDYNGVKLKMYTDKISGGVTGCMGFVLDKSYENYYSPNTVLKEDIRDIATNPMRIIATFTKNIGDELYTCISYTAKGIDYTKLNLPDELSQKISFENIICDFGNGTNKRLLK